MLTQTRALSMHGQWCLLENWQTGQAGSRGPMPAGPRICFRTRRGDVGGGHVVSVAMKATISSIMIALAAALLGCVAFRVSGPLPLKRQPQGYTVLLGVLDEDVRSDSPTPRKAPEDRRQGVE